MDHHAFVARHAEGGPAPRVNAWRACLVLEQTPGLPLEFGQGYRWQSLWAVACLVCGVLLLAFVPWWAALGVAAGAYLFRAWGIIAGALAAALVAYFGSWTLLTAGLCLAAGAVYGWLALRAARAELVALALADPETFDIAVEDKALLVEG